MVDTFRSDGLLGFTRGMSASYVGMCLFESYEVGLLLKLQGLEIFCFPFAFLPLSLKH